MGLSKLVREVEDNKIQTKNYNIFEGFLESKSSTDINHFIEVIRKIANELDENDFFKISEVCDYFLLSAFILHNQKKHVYNIKIYASLFINDVYAAVDALFKLKSLDENDIKIQSLSFLYFFSICYSQELYAEILMANCEFQSKYNVDHMPIEYQFYYYINFMMLFSNKLDYENTNKMKKKAMEVINRLNDDFYSNFFELVNLSSRVVFFEKYPFDIRNDEKLNLYINVLSHIDFSHTFSIVSLESHSNIISLLIKHNLLAVAEKISLIVYKSSPSSNAKLRMLKCIRSIYNKNKKENLRPFIEEYLDILEKNYSINRVLFKNYLSNSNRIFEQSKELDRIYEAYNHDALTACLSRAAFLDMKSSPHNENGYLIFFDLNDFKKINDIYGHNIGDKYLINFANILNKHFDIESSSYRIGGDEFVVITTISRIKLIEVLEKICSDSKLIFQDYYTGHCPYSAGIAYFTNTENLDKTLEKADKAMYYAKNTPDTYYYFSEDILE